MTWRDRRKEPSPMNLESQPQNLYETDFLKWLETTADNLRTHDYSAIDWENLIEEIEAMGRSERRRLKSNLIVLVLHLLKWQHQSDRRSGSWKGSIVEHRRRIRDDLADSPSLKPYLEQVLDDCYRDAVEQAAAETGLPSETFSELCPYSVMEILDTNFLLN
jgi:Domain of unknown function DUF29